MSLFCPCDRTHHFILLFNRARIKGERSRGLNLSIANMCIPGSSKSKPATNICHSKPHASDVGAWLAERAEAPSIQWWRSVQTHQISPSFSIYYEIQDREVWEVLLLSISTAVLWAYDATPPSSNKSTKSKVYNLTICKCEKRHHLQEFTIYTKLDLKKMHKPPLQHSTRHTNQGKTPPKNSQATKHVMQHA